MRVGFSYGLADFLPFRDAEACARVRAIPRDRLCVHTNPQFRIGIIEDPADLYAAFAADLVGRIAVARDAGRRLVLILPVGPVPQYRLAVRQINEMRLDCSHVHTFNMDEYADEDGHTAPADWPGSFQRAMWENFFGLIDRALRPPESQIHFLRAPYR